MGDLRARIAQHAPARRLIHCRGGLGYTGMIAARLLVELGMDAHDAIAAVRRVRPGAIETGAQEQHVLGCRRVIDKIGEA
jgi:ADP-ribosyl-[dinitrogen reductase] hydrolase